MLEKIEWEIGEKKVYFLSLSLQRLNVIKKIKQRTK